MNKIIYSSILAGCFALSGCGSDSGSTTGISANPNTSKDTLTGLWLLTASNGFTEIDFANDEAPEASQSTSSGTYYQIIQITDNDNGTLSLS
jgi:hypothetical protein